MEETIKNLPTKEDVKQTPKDSIEEGIIIETKQTTWKEHLSIEAINNFNKSDKTKEGDENNKIIVIDYEPGPGEEIYNYYDKPSDKSKVGRFLNKYDSLEPGTKIKVKYDGEGHKTILLD